MWLSRAGGDKGAFNQMLNRLETKVDRERRETLISALFFTRPWRAAVVHVLTTLALPNRQRQIR